MADPEEWRDIPGYEGHYQASSWGRLRSLERIEALPNGSTRKRNGRILKAKCGARYAMYSPSKDGVVRSISGHRLIMLAFVGPPKIGEVVCHYDGNGHNNHIKNLRYGTVKDNEEDKVRHGTVARGESSGVAKLTDKEVLSMRKKRAAGAALGELSHRYGVGMDTVSLICRGRTWAHVGGPIAQQDSRGSYQRVRPSNHSPQQL